MCLCRRGASSPLLSFALCTLHAASICSHQLHAVPDSCLCQRTAAILWTCTCAMLASVVCKCGGAAACCSTAAHTHTLFIPRWTARSTLVMQPPSAGNGLRWPVLLRQLHGSIGDLAACHNTLDLQSAYARRGPGCRPSHLLIHVVIL